jgi:argininosuccinate lyase
VIRPKKQWGGRFAGETNPLVVEYTSSTVQDRVLIAFDIAGSIAHARMLGRQSIIGADEAKKIVRGLEQIGEEYEAGAFELRDDLEDVHTNVEARLTELIGPVAGKLHTARSRNDQVATDQRLYALSVGDDAIGALHMLRGALLRLAHANADVVMPGYTHLQRAQPVLLAHHLLAYNEMFRRDCQRFVLALDMADELPLGSGALAGVPYPIDRESVREELQFNRITRNSIDAVSDRDFIVDFLSASAMTMVHISRLCEELVLWSSAEFGFIRLPDAFTTGSSIMPQKKNPDVAELARGRTGRAIGALMTMLTNLKGLPLAYNRDLQDALPAMLDSESVLLPTLEVLAAMIPEIVVDGERSRAAAVANYSLATDLADFLVRKGLPFREAHAAVGKLVRHAEEKHMELHELSLEEFRQCSPLFDKTAQAIDVAASVASRDVQGGTAPARVAEALTQALVDLATEIRMHVGDLDDDMEDE